MTDIKPYLIYCIGRKATIKTWQHRFVTKILSVHENGLVTVAHCYQNKDAWDAEYIIPHLRKLESLTEQEAKAMIEAIEGGEQIIEKITITSKGINYSFDEDYSWSEGGFIFFNQLSAAQFHYLTTIGIAWWATEEMWEKGLIFEVK